MLNIENIALTIGIFIPIFVISLQSAMATTAVSETSNVNRDAALFTNELLHTVSCKKTLENVIISPISIRTCLAMTYLGAENETAIEMQKVLHLKSGNNKDLVADEFSKLLHKIRSTDAAPIKMANHIYVDEKFEISSKFNDLISKYFDSKAENVRFVDSAATAEKINAWIEEQTDNKIKDIIKADSLDETTAAVLVNAIYFKADWLNNFPEYGTMRKDFHLLADSKVEIDMMRQEDKFLYSELKELDARAIEMAYKNTDLSMLIILPNRLDGLSDLVANLKQVNLLKITNQLKEEKVRLELPKFQMEYEISLQPTLEKLGIKKMFTSEANFNGLLKSYGAFHISEVKHKCFIEVNEKGTTAAGATFVKVSLESLIIGEEIYDFIVDHPFLFAIKDKESIYFVGHVVNL